MDDLVAELVEEVELESLQPPFTNYPGQEQDL